MSDTYNKQILERARELAEEYTGTTTGYIINKAIEDYEKTKDIEDLKYRIDRVEGDLAIERFHDANIIGERDVY